MKKSAKIIFIILIIITILLLGFSIAIFFFGNEISYALSDSEYIPSGVGERKNSYVITIPDVELLNKYQSEGEDMLVIFMASWCHFCQDEAPELNEFITKNPNKKVIVVSHDETKDDIEGYLAQNGYNWFVIFDPDKLIKNSIDPETSGIPAAYLLDSNGKILNHHTGKLDYKGITNLYDLSTAED